MSFERINCYIEKVLLKIFRTLYYISSKKVFHFLNKEFFFFLMSLQLLNPSCNRNFLWYTWCVSNVPFITGTVWARAPGGALRSVLGSAINLLHRLLVFLVRQLGTQQFILTALFDLDATIVTAATKSGTDTKEYSHKILLQHAAKTGMKSNYMFHKRI